jgi:hypothetical protein
VNRLLVADPTPTSYKGRWGVRIARLKGSVIAFFRGDPLGPPYV